MDTHKKIKNQLNHWVLFAIVWFLGYLQFNLVIELRSAWSNMNHVAGYLHMSSRLGEIIIFALAVVLIIYIILY